MGIVGRGTKRAEWEKTLEHFAPQKKTLIRANAYTCTAAGCFNNGRQAPSKLCAACNGTGYTGITPLPNNEHLMKEPAATLLFMFGDIQSGHGLYGSGGDLMQIISDLGRLQDGDATMFCKIDEINRQDGTLFHPDMQGSRPRPDWITTIHGDVYTVTKSLEVDFGDEKLCRIVTLNRGIQGAGGKI